MRYYYNSKLGLFFIQKFIPYSSFLGYALVLIFYGLKAYPLIIPIAAIMEPLKLIAILVFRKIGPYKIALNPSNNKIIFFLPYKGGEKEYNFSDIEKIIDQLDQLRFKCKNGKVYIFDISGRKENYIIEMITANGCEFSSVRFK